MKALFTCFRVYLFPCILPPMLLVIDIGNTNLTLGLYNGNELGAHWRLATDHARMPDEYGLQFQGLLQNAKVTAKQLTGICLARRIRLCRN
jgi:type III pantothenate kinase